MVLGLGEAPETYSRRVVAARPDLQESVDYITQVYQQIVFQGLNHNSLQHELGRAVRRFDAAGDSTLRQNILPFRLRS